MPTEENAVRRQCRFSKKKNVRRVRSELARVAQMRLDRPSRKTPNPSPELTRGTGSVLVFKSRRPRAAQFLSLGKDENQRISGGRIASASRLRKRIVVEI